MEGSIFLTGLYIPGFPGSGISFWDSRPWNGLDLFCEIRSGKGREFTLEHRGRVGNSPKISWNMKYNNCLCRRLDFTQLVSLEYTQWFLDLSRIMSHDRHDLFYKFNISPSEIGTRALQCRLHLKIRFRIPTFSNERTLNISSWLLQKSSWKSDIKLFLQV